MSGYQDSFDQGREQYETALATWRRIAETMRAAAGDVAMFRAFIDSTREGFLEAAAKIDQDVDLLERLMRGGDE